MTPADWNLSGKSSIWLPLKSSIFKLGRSPIDAGNSVMLFWLKFKISSFVNDPMSYGRLVRMLSPSSSTLRFFIQLSDLGKVDNLFSSSRNSNNCSPNPSFQESIPLPVASTISKWRSFDKNRGSSRRQFSFRWRHCKFSSSWIVSGNSVNWLPVADKTLNADKREISAGKTWKSL